MAETEVPTDGSSGKPGRWPDRWIGKSVPRKEDAALLTGSARFIDDMEPVAGLRHAAILRSPYAHAKITSIDASAALALSGVYGVVTGEQVAEYLRGIPSVVRTPIRFMPIAIDKARFVGEPVAVVVARDRYLAEDALDLIEVEYEPLDAAIDAEAAMADDAPVLHDVAGSNVAGHRTIINGDPESAFDEAAHVVSLDFHIQRYSSTPMETYGVVANFESVPDRYTVWSNFQGPFVIQPLMAGALGVPGNRLRLITAQASGGSFGIKQGVAAYIVLLCAVSRILGVPVKWTEDRLEHLAASSAATGRSGTVTGAFAADGELTALRFRNINDMGAFLRPPEPASVYRMQSTLNGCYGVQNIHTENYLVVTNKVPVGLNRGYGGTQFFYSLERFMDHAARELNIDPVDLRRRNFIDKDAFPYETPGGSVMDAGDYQKCVDELEARADYQALKKRRDEKRAEGKLYGIGIACAVEPSGSNMGYVSLAQTPEERAKSGAKSGANSSVVISMDPSGGVTVQLDSTPNGQGHATVTAQIVADALGITPDDVDVITEIDTMTSPWSIGSGNYGNRFSVAVTDAVVEGADRVARKLKIMAADQLECAVEDVELVEGQARIVGSDKALSLTRVGTQAHWNPVNLPDGVEPGIYETTTVTADLDGPTPEDTVASSVTYGAIFDLAAVEIDAETGRITIEKYVSVHDVGELLNPKIVEGQIIGGFVHGLGGAMFEEMTYDEDGNFLSGTFADYLCPTAMEVPDFEVGHVPTPSPKTKLGAKGLGDGSSMLAPAALTNAVADALGRADISPPLTMPKVWRWLQETKA